MYIFKCKKFIFLFVFLNVTINSKKEFQPSNLSPHFKHSVSPVVGFIERHFNG
mgnify:CR=1 FL=1